MAAEPVQGAIDPDTLEPAINTIISESKAGYKTTEFWVTVVVSTLAVVDPASLPSWAQGAVLAFAAGAYAISRGLAKQGIPSVEALPADAAVAVTTPPPGLD